MTEARAVVESLRAGEIPPALRELLSRPTATAELIALAIDGAGDDAARAAIDGYRAAGLDQDITLASQFYPPVFGADWFLRAEVDVANRMSDFGARVQGGALADGLDDIAREAARLADMRASYRRWGEAHDIHVLESQALARLLEAAGGLKRKRVLEIGCEEGRLLRAIRAQGAQVMGVDVAPGVVVIEGEEPLEVITGDAMTVDVGAPFDAVVAVAVFEWGSGWDPSQAPALLPRLYELTAPGGVCVVENVAIPLTFDDDELRAAGFERLDTNVLSATTVPRSVGAQGGRGVAMRRPS